MLLALIKSHSCIPETKAHLAGCASSKLISFCLKDPVGESYQALVAKIVEASLFSCKRVVVLGHNMVPHFADWISRLHNGGAFAAEFTTALLRLIQSVLQHAISAHASHHRVDACWNIATHLADMKNSIVSILMPTKPCSPQMQLVRIIQSVIVLDNMFSGAPKSRSSRGNETSFEAKRRKVSL